MGCFGCFGASVAHSHKAEDDTVVAAATPPAAEQVAASAMPEARAAVPPQADDTVQPHMPQPHDGLGLQEQADTVAGRLLDEIGGESAGGVGRTAEPVAAPQVTPAAGDADEPHSHVPGSDGHAPSAPGVEKLPVLASSSKVQNWLTSSMSDCEPGHSSSGLTPGAADGTIESGQADASFAGVSHLEAHRLVASLQPDGRPLPTVLAVLDLPGQAAPTPGTSASESEHPAESQLPVMQLPSRDRLRPLPGHTIPGSAARGEQAPGMAPHNEATLAALPVNSRLSSQPRVSSSISAPANTFSGIDGVLSLLRNRCITANEDNATDRPAGVMEDVSAIVASLHNPGVLSGASPADSADLPHASNPATTEPDPKEQNALLVPVGHRVQQLPPTRGGALTSMPDMQRQIADMFLADGEHMGDSAGRPLVSRSDLSGAWSPPSLAANEQDATSCSSTTSFITPLRMHTDTASQPYVGAPHLATESDRMDHLCSLHVLSTAPERRFDRLTALAATVFSVPIVLVSLVDRDRQWFKSVMGLPGVTETDRQSSFCAWTLLPQYPECLVVSDARNDARFRNNKLVTGPPHIQFYAGCPLVSSNGMRLGSLCIIDSRTRYFTTEDCNLLSNFAELAVRELEAKRADERLAFEEQPDEALRGREAWDVGLLSLHIVNESWVVRHGNDRAGQVLGVSDVDALIGTDFWQHVTLRDNAVRPSARFRRQLLEATDFSADVKAFTAAGRKVWLSCTFTSGTLSQVDDQCPVVSVPMDLTSEPGTKASYWFVAVRPLTDVPAAVTGFGGLMQSRRSRESQRGDGLLASSEFSEQFDADSLQDLAAFAQISETVHSQQLHVLHTPASRGAAVPEAGEHALAEIVQTPDPAAARAVLESTQQQWAQLGLPEHAVLDMLCVQEGRGALLLLRRLPMPICMSMRTAMHEGVFKNVPTAQQLHEGVVSVDALLVLDTLLQVARAVERLHAGGAVHGGICDTSLVATMSAPKAAPAARWRHGRDVQVSFATLGAAGQAVDPVHRSDLTTVRADLPLFYAPERFDAEGMLAPPTPAADIWALGMLLLYCMRLSLPLVREGFLALRAMAQEGTLLQQVLQLDEQPMPVQLRTLITLCLDVDPEARPSAARLVAALQHIRDLEADGGQHGVL
eukprot:jgi/Ulvmu1/1575/UM111_0003.1